LWVSLATVVPLTALILGITAYSEHLYQKNVDRDLEASMANIISELDFRLNYERDVINSLATSPAMQQFFPVLHSAAAGDLHPNYFEEVGKLNRFLAGFQHSVPGLDTVRVLDLDGNTLVKVRFGKHLPALFEGMDDVPFTEEELIGANFLNWLHQLKPYTLVYEQLPLSRRDFEAGQELAILNAIVPLADKQNKLIGFLSARALGNQLDRTLKALHRSHNFRINIIEINPQNKIRHGMLLYNDEHKIVFGGPHNPELKLGPDVNPDLWHQLSNYNGKFNSDQDNTHYYFQSFSPYNRDDHRWMIILQMDQDELSSPFQSIRLGLLAFAAVALVISLALANMGAIHIAEPISNFANTLKQYADGKTELKTHLPDNTEELLQLDQSFHYLVDNLELTEQQRDRAQKMMLQSAKLASIGEMAAGIGHEINNPLNNILSYVKLIERNTAAADQETLDDIHGLRNEALRASRIIKSILNFARQVPPEYTRFKLLDWIKDTLLLVEPEAHKHHIEMLLGDAPSCMLEGDRLQLQQVLVNLLMNAIHACEPDKQVHIRAELINDLHIKIIVSDQGKGISSDITDKLFDPFFSTKMVGEGSGLGLSISLGIIQYHGGELKLANNDQGGADAIITLPLNRDKRQPHA
ncbi:MAG: HAMP domain-containing histidine kinase, partial [Gammaproteobacteria bacterium]|nr:HAMP domain-containing histidine kinase [Gammaproteobacteria bacterium]